jgi:hypothetical protein
VPLSRPTPGRSTSIATTALPFRAVLGPNGEAEASIMALRPIAMEPHQCGRFTNSGRGSPNASTGGRFIALVGC